MPVTERPLTMRVATPADIPPVLALVRSAYRGATSREGWTTEADYLTDERIDEAGLLTKIEEPNGVVLMFFGPPSFPSSSAPAAAAGNTPGQEHQSQDGELLACCEVLRLPAPSKKAYFGLFAVRPKLQNGGVGRRALAEAERYARDEMGAGAMELHAIWLREELLAWYARRGYKLLEGEMRPFPYDQLVNGKALRDDLYLCVMEKKLV